MRIVAGVLALALAGCFVEEHQSTPCAVASLDPPVLARTPGAVNAFTIDLACDDAGIERVVLWTVVFGVRELPSSVSSTVTVGDGVVELRGTLRAEDLMSDPTFVGVYAVADNAEGAEVADIDWPSPVPGAAR